MAVLLNIGMCSMQECSYLAAWVEMGQFVYLMFSFCQRKEHTFQKKPQYCRKTEKKAYLSGLTRILCDLVYLLSKYF